MHKKTGADAICRTISAIDRIEPSDEQLSTIDEIR